MQFRVLGEVDVERDGVPVRLGGPQQRRLLALLLSERGRVVSTDRLVEALWPDADPPAGASRSVMKYVSRLRGVLGDSVIVTSGSGYRLELNGHGCDADDFEAIIDAADLAMPDAAVDRYANALRLWRGRPYGEFGDEWWARPESLRLAERRMAAELARAGSHMALGHHNHAVPELERLSAERPLDERPARLLMQALQATGRRPEALRVAHALHRRLAEETGLEPSQEFIRLERAIVDDDGSGEMSVGRPLRGYTIHDAIGEGAHGRVYTATQPATERRVAIKVIRPDLADSDEFVHRFEAEAQLVARLEHPHIVPLYDYWREPGSAFLVFRLLTGGTARDSVISGGPWSLPRVSRLLEEIGAALMSAHGAGVVHNDVKASNVLLDDEGAAYLSDFGIAGIADGSPHDAIADVRGLTWIAWELLTGARPPSQPTGSWRSWAAASVTVPSLVGRMPAVPDGLDAVVRRGINGGYASVAELVLAWRAASGGANGQSSPISSDSRRASARQLARAATAGVNPYRGLRPFDEAAARGFHGREGPAADLLTLLTTHSCVTIVGASGSGKSSVVLAGLVPALRARGDLVVTMTPGEGPLDALQTALSDVATAADSPDLGRIVDVARRAGRLVLVVDQFEELWTRAPQDQRDAFLDVVATVLADASIDVRLVSTVRADLLDRPLEHPKIGQLVGAGSYVLGPLSPAELAQAILRPAEDAGVTVDPGVVAHLVAEASTHAGALPLLQFTLTELYDRRVDGVLGPSALAAIGGMGGAVGRRSEAVYLTLSDPARADARQLFDRLVAPGTNAPDTRRRARLGELSPGMRAVADRFVVARLLVADRDAATREPTVEVAHEALLTHWSRLAAWREEDRRWLLQLQHLSAAARAWDEGGRPVAELYRGSRLEALIEAVDIDRRSLSETERRFLEAGRTNRDAEVRAAQRTARRLRRLLMGVAAALLVALAAGAVAVVQRRQAEDNAVAAEIEALVGRAESLRSTQRDVAALLAVESFRLADTPRTRSALLATFTDQTGFYDAHRLEQRSGRPGIVMPDGESAYLVDDDGRLRPYSLETGLLGEPYPPIGDRPIGGAVLAASADGRWVAQASRSEADGSTTVVVFDTRTRSASFPPVVVDGLVWSVAFTSDADLVALAIGEEARLLVVDRATGEQKAALSGVELPERSGEIAPEPEAGRAGPVPRSPAVVAAGDDLLLGSADGSLRVLSSNDPKLQRTIIVAADMLTLLRPLQDGTLLAAGRGGVARVDIATGTVLERRDQGFAATGDSASSSTCAQLAVVEQRGTFYCGNAYGRLAEHDLETLYPIRVLDAQNGNSGSLWSARGGTELVGFGDNEPVVSRWRLDRSGPITHLVGPGFRGWRFNPGGDLLILERGGPFDGTASKVVAVDSGDVVRTLDGLINADWIDHDTVVGALINEAGEVETAHIDLDSGDLVADGFIIDPIPNGAYSFPGKQRPLLVYRNGTGTTLRQYDRDAQRLGPEIAVDGGFSSSISRTGHRIAAGTPRGIEIFDGFTGEPVGSIPGSDLRGVFITVTDQLFVSSLGGELTLYDLDTLEPVRRFGGSRGFITQVEGTADGTLIATKGGDHRVILYDVATGTRIGTPISIADDESNWIDLSLDGRWLSVGGEAATGEHSTQIWNLDPEAWITAACRSAGRNLTGDEWAAHIGSLAPYRATCPDFPAPD
jgi:DNA-binding SARP family transcriptional activator/tRNA A-37 threonylcarbamoyl transferase component Bud32